MILRSDSVSTFEPARGGAPRFGRAGKGAVFAAACAFSFLLAAESSSYAAVNLKQVQVSGGSRVDLLFDGRVGRNQIRTEFFGETIQISLTDAAVYPAKISSISGGQLTKIFAYQYAPKLVRCRLTVKGKAEDYRNRLILDQRGKVLTVRFGEPETASSSAGVSAQASLSTAPHPGTDTITSHSAKAVPSRAAEAPVPANPERAGKAGESEAGEKALLERILKSPAKEADAPTREEASQREGLKPENPRRAEPLTGGKPLGSPFRMFLKMMGVIALFGLFAMMIKRALRGGAPGPQAREVGKGGALGRFVRSSLGKYAKTGKMIEVVSTHHLGPKKSIAVVRVAGRMLVLGISNESINLITQLGPEGGLEAAAGEETGIGDFDLEALGVKGQPQKRAEPASPTGTGPLYGARGKIVEPEPSAASAGHAAFSALLEQERSRPMSGVRAQIRTRLEGMKPL